MSSPSSQGPCTCPEMGWRNDCPRHEHMQDTERYGIPGIWRDHLAPRYNRDLCNLLFRLAQNYWTRSGMSTSNHFDVLIHPRAIQRLQQDPKLYGSEMIYDTSALVWMFMGFRVLQSHDVDEHDVRLVIKSDHPWFDDLPRRAP